MEMSTSVFFESTICKPLTRAPGPEMSKLSPHQVCARLQLKRSIQALRTRRHVVERVRGGAPCAATRCIRNCQGECVQANAVGFIDLRVSRKTSVESLFASATWVAVVGRAAVGMLVTRESVAGDFARFLRRRRLPGFVGRYITMVLGFTSGGTSMLCVRSACAQGCQSIRHGSFV